MAATSRRKPSCAPPIETTKTTPETKLKPGPAYRCGACHANATAQALMPERSAAKGWSRFRMPTMDRASEKSKIRRAVDGIRALTFQLGQRTLATDATGTAVELAVAADRNAGFGPQPLAVFGNASMWMAIFADMEVSLLSWATGFGC